MSTVKDYACINPQHWLATWLSLFHPLLISITSLRKWLTHYVSHKPHIIKYHFHRTLKEEEGWSSSWQPKKLKELQSQKNTRTELLSHTSHCACIHYLLDVDGKPKKKKIKHFLTVKDNSKVHECYIFIRISTWFVLTYVT